mgnify:CR=1 FL=1
MSSFKIFDIAGSGMNAQNLRMNVVASNLANVDAVSSSIGATYRARQPVFQAVLDQANAAGPAVGVQMAGVVESQAPLVREYSPHHAMADKDGYIYRPNVNVVEEMANMISASRAYQNNVEVVNATVAGGSGTEAKAVLKTRMLGGDPPDTFQVHAGQEPAGGEDRDLAAEHVVDRKAYVAALRQIKGEVEHEVVVLPHFKRAGDLIALGRVEVTLALGTAEESKNVAKKDNKTDDKAEAKEFTKATNDAIRDLQYRLFVERKQSLLIVLQAMDAGGKDSTIRAVMQGVDPSGCQVFSFKKPSSLELDHDFLWRTTCRLPERGRIGIFNRSQYEEVLVVRVHPTILDYQKLPNSVDLDTIWEERLKSIREQEEHLARKGTEILKFWLNVYRDEQKRRFLARLDDPDKNWKFNPGDVAERRYWDDYMHAYEEALNATSRPWAPWYAIPADDKPYMRARVARIIIDTLESIGLEYPEPSAEDRAEFARAREELK